MVTTCTCRIIKRSLLHSSALLLLRQWLCVQLELLHFRCLSPYFQILLLLLHDTYSSINININIKTTTIKVKLPCSQV